MRRAIRFASLCEGLAGFESRAADVCFGSKADIGACPRDVRFTPESGHCRPDEECLLCAKSGHQFYSEFEDASTLYAAIGRRMPFSSNSPTGSTVTALSMACRTRGLMRIWPGLASSQRREATFETVPMAA